MGCDCAASRDLEDIQGRDAIIAGMRRRQVWCCLASASDLGEIAQSLGDMSSVPNHGDLLRCRWLMVDVPAPLRGEHQPGMAETERLLWQAGESPIYVAVIVLRRRMNWRYLEIHWSNEGRSAKAMKALSSICLEYATLDKSSQRRRTLRWTSHSLKADSLVATSLSNHNISGDDGGSFDIDR